MQKTENNAASEKYLEQVSEFHKLMKQPILDIPQIPIKERALLRISLIQEELDELKEAIENNDKKEALDALCDLQYVVSGSVLEFGMKEIFPEAFAEVHRSNMSKACPTIEDAKATQKFYLDEKGVETYIVERDNKFFVLRSEDNKQLKSISYSPADLNQFLAQKEEDREL
ncbi:MAG TPA: nucleoside triphosphate pyrophosphohydrolase family protein [Bacteroidales bacterium]|nr:nucleoside triphosphate pyrophosphohydrolase family protein [Bacteroidales bacterium]